MNVIVIAEIFSPLKIVTDGGQGPGNNGGSATTMALKSHIEGELHSISQVESFWLKSALSIQVVFQTHEMVFAMEVRCCVIGTVLS
jgi:hypothetical protein